MRKKIVLSWQWKFSLASYQGQRTISGESNFVLSSFLLERALAWLWSFFTYSTSSSSSTIAIARCSWNGTTTTSVLLLRPSLALVLPSRWSPSRFCRRDLLYYDGWSLFSSPLLRSSASERLTHSLAHSLGTLFLQAFTCCLKLSWVVPLVRVPIPFPRWLRGSTCTPTSRRAECRSRPTRGWILRLKSSTIRCAGRHQVRSFVSPK